jgi:hypothetical protein
MTPSHRKRTQLYVDPKVQGALALRVVLYWIVCILAVTVMLLCWELLTAPVRELSTRLNDMWFHYGPALVASFLLLPLVVLDIIRMSHRFAGPLVRMRAAMRSLARCETVAPISFREDDFWLEFAQDFNAVAARLQRDPPSAGTPAHPGDDAESDAPAVAHPDLVASVD